MTTFSEDTKYFIGDVVRFWYHGFQVCPILNVKYKTIIRGVDKYLVQTDQQYDPIWIYQHEILALVFRSEAETEIHHISDLYK